MYTLTFEFMLHAHHAQGSSPCTPSVNASRRHRTFDDIEIRDISLEDYIAVKGKYATFLPHTAGRYQKKRFRKATVSYSTWDGLLVHRKTAGTTTP